MPLNHYRDLFVVLIFSSEYSKSLKVVFSAKSSSNILIQLNIHPAAAGHNETTMKSNRNSTIVEIAIISLSLSIIATPCNDHAVDPQESAQMILQENLSSCSQATLQVVLRFRI